MTLPFVTGALLVMVDLLTLGDLLGVTILTIIDSLRTLQLACFNASERHGRCAAWTSCEAWFKPLMAVLYMHFWGPSSGVALLGYATGGFLVAILFADRARLLSWLRLFGTPVPPDDFGVLRQRVSTYVRPLLPLAAIAWVSGMGDRYVLGSLLTLRDVGIYVAAYGLASRPFLMLATAIELTMRPRYQHAVSAANDRHSDQVLRVWIKLIVTLGGAGAAALALAPGLLPELLLAEEYRAEAATLLPWIGLGYLLLVVSQVMERVCYAHGNTGYILRIALAGAVIAAPASLLGIHYMGLVGAAAAVPVVFGAQLLVAYIYSRRSLRLYGDQRIASKGAT
jgi:O-antigen/teichoic acid export membrane protein